MAYLGLNILNDFESTYDDDTQADFESSRHTEHTCAYSVCHLDEVFFFGNERVVEILTLG